MTEKRTAARGGTVFWALNGKLDRKEMLRQIDCLAQMGFRGVFLHSRTGLETEYLGQEWMSLLRDAAERLSQRGVETWLYDEDRWPSGTCGGRVTRRREFRLKSLVYEFGAPEDARYCFAVRMRGETLEEYRALDGRDSALREGERLLCFCIREMAESDFYNGNTYVDLMNAEAVQIFFRETHEKYAESMGELFGEKISGIFTDEPHRGCFLNGFGQAGEDACMRIPWSARLFKKYRELWGKDAETTLPELLFRRENEFFSAATYRYASTCLELFLESFGKPYAAWCNEHGLLLTGHMLNEDNLAGQATMCGDLAPFYALMDLPGIDNLGTCATHMTAVKYCDSVAEQFGKPGVLSELYGATGWQTSFFRYKTIGDWQTLLGVTSRCAHLAWYTMRGEAKRDYPASISLQSAWWKDFSYLEDYFNRFSDFLSGESIAELLILHPVESAWGLFRANGFHHYFSGTDAAYERLERCFRTLCESMVFHGTEFDYGSERLMQENASLHGDRLVIGARSYRRVLVCGALCLRPTTIRLLNAFSETGGEVVFAGELPHWSNGEAISEPLCGKKMALDADLLAEYFGARQSFAVQVNSERRETLALRVRKNPSGFGYALVLLNLDRERSLQAEWSTEGVFSILRTDLRKGGESPFRCEKAGGKTLCRYEFSPGEELALRYIPVESAKQSDLSKKQVGHLVELPEKFDYSLSEPNVLVLDRAQAFIAGESLGVCELVSLDDALRRKFGYPLRGREMLQPWFRKAKISLEGKKLELCFRFFSDIVPTECFWCGETLNEFHTVVNGHPLNTPIEQDPEIDICFERRSIPCEYFQLGENLIVVTCDFGETELETFYLKGNFGVEVGEICRLTELPVQLRFGNLADQGFPFYTGRVFYHVRVPRGRYGIKLRYGGAFAAAIGTNRTMLAFPPYRGSVNADGKGLRIELCLTRKNLFGPLHRKPADSAATVPAHFHGSENEQPEYILLEQGLFELELREEEKNC